MINEILPTEVSSVREYPMEDSDGLVVLELPEVDPAWVEEAQVKCSEAAADQRAMRALLWPGDWSVHSLGFAWDVPATVAEVTDYRLSWDTVPFPLGSILMPGYTGDLFHFEYIGVQLPDDDRIYAPYSPVSWPDEGYPCEVCWARSRWPWEPMRACPINIEPIYCPAHQELINSVSES